MLLTMVYSTRLELPCAVNDRDGADSVPLLTAS
jgi:hypothetical protein